MGSQEPISPKLTGYDKFVLSTGGVADSKKSGGKDNDDDAISIPEDFFGSDNFADGEVSSKAALEKEDSKSPVIGKVSSSKALRSSRRSLAAPKVVDEVEVFPPQTPQAQSARKATRASTRPSVASEKTPKAAAVVENTPLRRSKRITTVS